MMLGVPAVTKCGFVADGKLVDILRIVRVLDVPPNLVLRRVQYPRRSFGDLSCALASDCGGDGAPTMVLEARR